MAKTKIYKHGATLVLEITGEALPIPINYPDYWIRTDEAIIFDSVRNPAGDKSKFTWAVKFVDVTDEAGVDIADQSALGVLKYIATEMNK